jgi:predicted metal-dependent peptidase
MTNKASTAPDKASSTSAALARLKRVDVPAELMRQCLDTALFEVGRHYTFYGSVLQCMNIMYSYVVPTAGVMFNSDMKRYELLINPVFFCKALSSEARTAVMVHEVQHITNKHLTRVPFLKVSDHKRKLLNIAGDMAINQTIKNLPKGCKQCPPLEAQKQGAYCKNELCPGHAVDVKDWFYQDEKSSKRTPWPASKTMEFYFEELMKLYEEKPEEEKTKQFMLDHVFDGNFDAAATGAKRGKSLTATDDGELYPKVKKGHRVLLPHQKNALDNGIYVVENPGSANTKASLVRFDGHDGHDDKSSVKPNDAGALKKQTSFPPKGWVVTNQKEVNVDSEPMTWQEAEMQQSQGDGSGDRDSDSGGTPREFDSHNWGSGAEEGDVLDATEELIKRAMLKESLSYDQLPGHVKDLLDDIKVRRAELNYRSLILAAIKRSASGFDRKRTWLKASRRYEDDAPGLKMSEYPQLHFYIDTSGSISIEEANQFLEICDEFLKVGCRKTQLNLFSDVNYHTAKYKMGDRVGKENIRKAVNMGGTCLESSLKEVLNRRADLAIFLTDGCYGDVGVESWMKPGQKFPQTLWVISENGQESHPLARLGTTIKIPAKNKAK